MIPFDLHIQLLNEEKEITFLDHQDTIYKTNLLTIILNTGFKTKQTITG